MAFATKSPFVTVTAMSLWVGLLVQAADGRFDQAAALLAKVNALPATSPGLLDRLQLTIKVRASLEAHLGPTAFAAAWKQGKTQPVETMLDALRTSLGI